MSLIEAKLKRLRWMIRYIFIVYTKNNFIVFFIVCFSILKPVVLESLRLRKITMNKLPYDDSSKEDIFRYANELIGLEFACIIERYLKTEG